MNTKERTGGRTLLTTSALLVALSLPFAIFAQEGSVGFAESDPAFRQTGFPATAPRTIDDRESRSVAGFAETDSAIPQSEDAAMFAKAINSSVRRQIAGFAETDPAADRRRSAEEFQGQALLANQFHNQEDICKR
jgi:hypothetical protein